MTVIWWWSTFWDWVRDYQNRKWINITLSACYALSYYTLRSHLTLFFYCFTGTPKCKAHIDLKTFSSWDRNDLIYTKNNIKLTKKPMKQNLWLALIEMKHHKWKQRKFFFNSPMINWIFKHESTKPIPYSLTHTPFLQNTCSLEIPVQHY